MHGAKIIVRVTHSSAVAFSPSRMSDKLNRTIARFQQKIDNKDFYEAHQTLRTIANRYVKLSHYEEAIDLLTKGLSILASNNEFASSSDLIVYLIEVYTEAGIRCDNGEESRNYKLKLLELISLLPDTDPSLGDVAKKALAWSKEGSDSKFGDSALHHLFGSKTLAAAALEKVEEDRSKLFLVAELHLILGTHESLPVYVDYLFQWSQTTGKSADPGVFASRAVINYAYLRNIKFARSALEQFVLKYLETSPSHQNAEGFVIFAHSELLNFLQLLVVTLGKVDAGEKFMTLYSQYKPLLVEKDLVAPVEYLGRFYFNLPLGNAQNGNMLANLMSGLFK